MANETKVGVAVFTALVGVFGFVLYRKYDDQLTAIAALHGPENGAAETGEGDGVPTDPLTDEGGAGSGAMTAAADTGDLSEFGDAFGGEPSLEDSFGTDPLDPAANPAAPENEAVAVADVGRGDPDAGFDAAPDEPPAADADPAFDWALADAAPPAAPESADPAPIDPAPAVDDPFGAELDALDPPAATVAATTASSTEQPATEEPPAVDWNFGEPAEETPAPTEPAEVAVAMSGEPAPGTEVFPGEDVPADGPAPAAPDLNEWPAEMAPAAVAAAEPVAEEFLVEEPVAEEPSAIVEPPIVAAAEEPAGDAFWGADAPAAEPVALAEDEPTLDAEPVTLDAELTTLDAEPAAVAAADPLFPEDSDEPAPAEPPAMEAFAFDEPLSEEPAAAVAFDAPAPPADAPADLSPAADDAGAMWDGADAFASLDPAPAPAEQPTPAEPEAAGLWDATAETATPEPTLAAEMPAADTPAAAEPAFDLMPEMEPTPVELAAADPASPEIPVADEPAFDGSAFFEPPAEPAPAPAAETVAAVEPSPPAMAEWPDLSAPPAAPQPPVAPPAPEIAAAPPEPELTPAAFAPEANRRSPEMPDSRPVRNASAEKPMPFRFSGPNDRKVAEVQPGESYWTVSKRAYGAAKYFKALARYNALRIRDPRNLQPGMKVICPPPGVLMAYDTDLADAERSRESAASNPSWSGYGVDDRGRPVWMVSSGDTLGGIAQKTLGRASRAEQIFALNRDKIRDPRRLKPGVLLNLPADAAGLRRRGATR